MPSEFDWRIGVLDQAPAVCLQILYGKRSLADLRLEQHK
jgi:hypothetical protein